MTLSTVAHDTFVIERTYDVAVAQIFRAWADPKLKARWFAGSVDALGAGYELDFRWGVVRSIAVGLRAGRSIRTSHSSTTSFPNNGSSTPTRCMPMRLGSLCPWQRSSSAARTPQRIWFSPSRGYSSMATTQRPRENREPSPFWTRWLPL